tara:strand:+ start:437 stop:748 length:312 start_codon:yes stop_codon:yes gene_type:complete
MKDSTQIVSELTSKVSIPLNTLGRGIKRTYKEKAKKFFETMKIEQSFSVENRSVEAVKKWAKDWRKDLRATGKKSAINLCNRGFLTKHEIVNNTNGVRVWRFK